MTTIDEKVAELSGKVKTLEKLLMDVVMGQLVEVKLRCINAETTAVRATESLQELVSSFQSGESEMAGSGDGFLDVRQGAVFSKATKSDDEGDA